MLSAAGAAEIRDLFGDIDPALHPGTMKLPVGLTEQELVRRVQALAAGNHLPRHSFLGGGAYPHFTPAVVDAVLSRGEFFTSYTPYQAEAAQGGLQAAWEYQSLVTSLTGLPVANASLYDGSTSAAEAMLMATRNKPGARILVSRTVDPRYRAVLSTYARARDIPVEEIDYENGVTSPSRLTQALAGETAGVILQSPNYFGLIEDLRPLASAAQARGALCIALWTEALSLALYATPGEAGVDIAAGEGASFGGGLNYGGPGLGMLAARATLLRKIPGRIVGRTRDGDGRTGFVLTMQAREQHIRREAASSNVCSNHALCALAAAVYLALLGGAGLRRLAEVNYHRSHFAKKKILSLRAAGKKRGPLFQDPLPGHFFNEFVVKTPRLDSRIAAARRAGIAAGLPLEPDYPELKDCLLVAVTETHSREDIEELREALS
jgi:glycine dehydrogenase subunit 1